MKTGIFGGSFNPFHMGHKKALAAFINELALDRAFVIPTALPPHKQAEKSVSDEDRLKIAALSVSDIKKAEVSDWEIKNGGKSYTYLTLEHFQKEFPNDELFLYVGTDMFLSLHEWKNPEKITAAAVLCAFARENGDAEKLEEQKKFLEKKYGAKCFIGKSEPFEISSTEIRKNLSEGSDVSDYLDKKAAEYIKEKHLYALPSPDAVIKTVKPLLKPERFRHSLGVRDEIVLLAKIYGADVKKAEICGLLHDITKNFPDEWHLNYIKENKLAADESFLKTPQLYHALTGSCYAEKVLKISDPEILSAIKYHTTAKPDMTLLEKLLYVADFTEPTRNYSDVGFYRDLARRDIDRTVLLGLRWNIENLKNHGKPVYFLTEDAEKFYTEKERKDKKDI